NCHWRSVTRIAGLRIAITLITAGRPHAPGALRGAERDAGSERPWLGVTWVLGALFLGVQGFEWIGLIGHGLTMTSSVYGALFYTVIGFHALHVAIGCAS
ncbi:MAG: cytochrome c oxidase subunit 3, partial [Candidatus Poribacteria bacterium]